MQTVLRTKSEFITDGASCGCAGGIYIRCLDGGFAAVGLVHVCVCARVFKNVRTSIKMPAANLEISHSSGYYFCPVGGVPLVRGDNAMFHRFQGFFLIRPEEDGGRLATCDGHVVGWT